MDLHFEIATSEDTETLITFIREYYAYDKHPFDEAALRPALDAIVREPAFGRVWLIQDGDLAIGYVVLTLGYSLEYLGRDAFVDELYVRESHRGQGVGARALAFVEDVCRQLGVRALHLEVERENTRAYYLYSKSGFRDQQRYLMTKRIAPSE